MSTEKKFAFTDNRLRSIVPPSEKKRTYYFDTKTAGLRLQVTSNGTMTFQFQVWDAKRGKPVTRTLGKYPALSIVRARELAIDEMAHVTNGVDIEKEAHRLREEDTLDTLFDRWLVQFAKPHKRSWQEDVRRYELYMRKPLGKKKISWFTSNAIRTWHHNITKMEKQRGTGTISQATANRSLALLSTIFNQMLPERNRQTNPIWSTSLRHGHVCRKFSGGMRHGSKSRQETRHQAIVLATAY